MRRMKLILMAVIMTISLNSCIYHKMSADEMVADMHEINSDPVAMINILWYEGSDAKFDYFGYVYAMMRSKNFKVPVGELVLPRIERTDDETKWMRIKKIDGVWSASRLNYRAGVWRPDEEGISIEIGKGSAR